jgi:hypothetical protein
MLGLDVSVLVRGQMSDLPSELEIVLEFAD